MNLIIPFLLALWTGGLIFGAIYKNEPWKDALGILVSFWLGLAGCAMAVFYGILITGHYDPLNVLISTFMFMIFCCLLCYFRRGKHFLCYQGLGAAPWLQLTIVVLLAVVLMKGLSYHKLYGNWDAWSFWNFRARYLVLAGSHWRDVFTYEAEVKHPWLLPLWTVFGWTWLGKESYAFPFLSAQIFCLIVLATVFFSILDLTKSKNASFLATLWLASIPYFLIHSISQYPAVIMASLIVLNMMLLFRLYRRKTRADAVTFGIMLGVMSFTKDEGIGSALFITVFAILLLRKCKDLCFPFFMGLGLTLVPTVLVKYLMYPAPNGVSTVYFPYILEWKRWVDIIQYFMAMFIKPVYGGIWIIPLFLLGSMLLKPWDEKDRAMAGFLAMFGALYLLLYFLIVNYLDWRLLVSGDRMMYQILPLAIVFLFYRLFGGSST